jgi:DHA3 family macrolide efflux protein-like MFS transporter
MALRILTPLRHRAIVLLWSGLATSSIGDQLYAVALAWIGVSVFGARAGYLSALSSGCLLVTALAIGHWADRWDRRRTMIAADLVRAAVLAVLVLAWSWVGAPPSAGLVVTVICLAIGAACFEPALQAVLPGVVPDTRLLPAANALLDATDRIARLLGPGMVAVLASLIPIKHFLTLDALTFLVSAGAMGLVGPVSTHHDTGARPPILATITRGFRAMSQHRLLWYTLRTSPIWNGAWTCAYLLALPLVIARHGITGPGGSGMGAYGLVISAYGCTNLLATLVVGSRDIPKHPQRLVLTGKIVNGAGTGLLALAGLLPAQLALPALAASAAVAAIGGPMGDIPIAVLRQTALPISEVPAAMRAYLVCSSGGALAALVIAPTLIQHLGLFAVTLGCALLIIGSGIGGFLLLGFGSLVAEPVD